MADETFDLAGCLDRVRARDQNAARTLVEHLYPLVIRIVRSHLPRRVAEEAVVLLKNTGGALPLDPSQLTSIAVIGDVYKTEVYRLARYRNSIGSVIPEETLTKAPSAELRPNQKDQDSLPPYEVLDEILRLYIEKNLGRDAIVSRLKKKISAAVIADTVRKVDHNEYKRRQTPPILRVTEKAWFGRRMPITNRFQG